MKLILLYGPPAAGKLTVAKELAKLTEISLFHSHMILNDLASIFGYDSPERRKLEVEFKRRILEEVVASDKNLITTGSVTRENKEYYNWLINLVKKVGGKVFLVRFTADRDVLHQRVKHESRAEKINSPEKLDQFLKMYPENLEKFGEGEQFVLDTSELTPQESAKQIADRYDLI